jgi:squalene synthase HpnC
MLLPAAKRAKIMAYYRIARHADDIADSPVLLPEEKLAGLDALDAGLQGRDQSPAVATATAYRQAVDGDPELIEHASQLLHAFRRDAVRDFCHDWSDLMAYCRYSAAPVGRFLLDLHGESHDTFPSADALCAALQVLNHLQDIGKDYRELKRVYVPRDWLQAAGLTNRAFAGDISPPALRAVLDMTLDATGGLIEMARPLPGLIRDRRLRAETAITLTVAEKLADFLRAQDPLATRVQLTPLNYAVAVATGLFRALTA